MSAAAVGYTVLGSVVQVSLPSTVNETVPNPNVTKLTTLVIRVHNSLLYGEPQLCCRQNQNNRMTGCSLDEENERKRFRRITEEKRTEK